MIIKVKVKPRSGKRSVESFGDNKYLIYLKEEPENNKANIELINLLSRYFGIPISKIRIKTGLHNNEKTIELL